MDINKIIEFSQTIPGYYDQDELERLLSLTINNKPSVIVEIGVEFGRSASVFIQCPEYWDELFLIDNRSHNAEEGRNSTQKLIDAFGPLPILQVEQDSGWAALTWDHVYPNKQIDLLHIDGDHEDGIWYDCSFWLPKVKIGGIMVAHDYKRKGADPTTGSVFPEVDKAIDQYTGNASEWEDLGVVNTQVARRKLK